MIGIVKREDYNSDEEYQEARKEMLELIKEHDKETASTIDRNNPHTCNINGTIKVLKQ